MKNVGLLPLIKSMTIPDQQTKEQHLSIIDSAFEFERGFPLLPHLIVMNYIGSMSHNTYVPKDDPNSIDDIDFMGVMVPPMNYTLGITDFKTWVYQQGELDVTVYSMQAFASMMAKSNPNVLSLLWQEIEYSIYHTREWLLLREMRHLCVSQQAYYSYGQYAKSQMRKMQPGVFAGYMGEKRKQHAETFGYDTKMASHTIRLLRMGLELLQHQRLTVFRTDDAEELKAIKRGDWTLDDVQALAHTLLQRFDAALESHEVQSLPTQPSHNAVSMLCAIVHEQVYRLRMQGATS